MLFWIFLAILIGGIVWTSFDEWSPGGLLLAIIGAAAVIISCVCFAFEHPCTDAIMASYAAERESLVYQYENDLYDNDNDLGKKELMTEITEFNKKLVTNQQLQNNFWVGIYFADIYDQLEPIPLETTEEGS